MMDLGAPPDPMYQMDNFQESFHLVQKTKFKLFVLHQMETFLEIVHLIHGVRGGSQIQHFPGKFSSGSLHKDIFIGSHSDIRVETGIPMYQMDNFQKSVHLGRGLDAVYEMKI